MESKGRELLKSTSSNELNQMDTCRSNLTNRLSKTSIQPVTISTKNSFEKLTEETAKARSNGIAAQKATITKEKTSTTVAKLNKYETSLINVMMTQICGLIYFEHAFSHLRIRTVNKTDHNSVIIYLNTRVN